MQKYETSDMNLASFLYAKGVELVRVRKGSDIRRCIFEFNVPKGIILVELLKQRDSPETDLIRTVLHRKKNLQTEIGKFYSFKNMT